MMRQVMCENEEEMREFSYALLAYACPLRILGAEKISST